MYIDYLTLMLINLTAGLVQLAGWIYLDWEKPTAKRWAPGLLIVGFLATVCGLHMILTWPLPGSFNLLFGELSVFFGVLALGLAWVLWSALDLLPIALYAEFVGLAALIIGVQVIDLGITKTPLLNGIAILWMGVIGIFAVPMLSLRKVPAFRTFGVAGLLVAAVLWAVIGYGAYWGHAAGFMKWQPAGMKYEQEMQQPK